MHSCASSIVGFQGLHDRLCLLCDRGIHVEDHRGLVWKGHKLVFFTFHWQEFSHRATKKLKWSCKIQFRSQLKGGFCGQSKSLLQCYLTCPNSCKTDSSFWFLLDDRFTFIKPTHDCVSIPTLIASVHALLLSCLSFYNSLLASWPASDLPPFQI